MSGVLDPDTLRALDFVAAAKTELLLCDASRMRGQADPEALKRLKRAIDEARAFVEENKITLPGNLARELHACGVGYELMAKKAAS